MLVLGQHYEIVLLQNEVGSVFLMNCERSHALVSSTVIHELDSWGVWKIPGETLEDFKLSQVLIMTSHIIAIKCLQNQFLG